MTAQAPFLKPLGGARVLELGQGVAVRAAGRLLRDLGAEITRVELSGRRPRSPQLGLVLDLNKRIERATGSGRERWIAAAGEFDAVVSGPDWSEPVASVIGSGGKVPTTWVHITSGPVPNQNDVHPCDGLLADAAYGVMYQQQGHRPGPFCLAEPSAAHVTGLIAATGAVAGMLLVANGQVAPFLETTYADGAVAVQSLSAAFPPEAAQHAIERYRDPYSVAMSPAIRFHQARDGWVLIAALTDRQWRKLIDLTADPELISDPRLEIPSLSLTDQDLAWRVTRGVAAWAGARTVDQVMSDCGVLDLIAVPVLDHAQFLGHEQCLANDLAQDVVSGGAKRRLVGNFVQMTATAQSTRTAPPTASLTDFTVLDFSSFIAAPNCGRILADLGMNVVKVEAPTGDPWRYMGYSFAAANRGKRSLAADLKTEGARPMLSRLLAGVDITISNLRSDAEARFGLSAEALAAANPAIVRAHFSGLGVRGPLAARPAIDVAGQALAGSSLAEGGGSEPVGFTSGALDSCAGWLGSAAILSALYHRRRTGSGVSIESGLLHCAAFFQMRSLVVPGIPGEPRVDHLRLGYSAFERLYQTSDGWICTAVVSPSERRALAGIAGLQARGRQSVHGRVGKALAREFGRLTTGQAAGRLKAAGVVNWSPVRSLEEAARSGDGVFTEVPQRPWGWLLEPRRSLRFSGVTAPPLAEAPAAVGSDSRSVLEEGGLERVEIAALIGDGTVPPEPIEVATLAMSV